MEVFFFSSCAAWDCNAGNSLCQAANPTLNQEFGFFLDSLCSFIVTKSTREKMESICSARKLKKQVILTTMNMYLNREIFYKKLAVAPDRSFLSLKHRGIVTKQQIGWRDLDHLRKLMEESPGEEDVDYKTSAFNREVQREEKEISCFKKVKLVPFS